MVETFAFNQVQSQLGVPDSSTFFPIRKSETVIVENHPLVIQKVTTFNSFALDSYPNGLMDNGAYYFAASAIASALDDHYIVANDNNTFQWRFRYTQGSIGANDARTTIGFTDSAESVGTEDVTTNYNFTGTLWYSLPIFRDPSGTQQVSTVTLTELESSVENDTIEASNDGGVTWTTITLNTTTAFPTLGSELLLRVTGGGAGWPTMFGTWGESTTMIISSIKCEYTIV